MRCKAALFPALAILSLAGCGGNQTPVASTGPDPVPETLPAPSPASWLVDAETARGHIAGSTVLALTSDELPMLDENTVAGADKQLFGGIYFAGRAFPGYILGTDCEEGTCRYGTNGVTSLEDHIFDLEYQPVMEVSGIRLGQARKRIADSDNPLDITGYGAWKHYGAFSIQVDFLPSITNPAAVQFINYSVGKASGTNPASGAATWAGAAVAMDLNRLIASPDVLQGDAEIAYDFAGLSVDVTLDGFRNLRTGEATGHRLEWADMTVEDGGFSDGTQFDGRHIDGAFYGAYHEEVGGVFKAGPIAGSFGASRTDRH